MSLTTERFALGVALVIGVVVRAAPIIGADSVVGDGGLWFAMIDDIRAAGLSVPATTSYNDLGIPFVYPPAALLGTAAVGDAFGIPTIELLRWAPRYWTREAAASGGESGHPGRRSGPVGDPRW